MKNKTKEQLSDERYKEFSTPIYNGMSCIQKQAFVEGWYARQPEIDALIEVCQNSLRDIQKINKQLIQDGKHGYILMENELNNIIRTHLNKQNHE